MRGWSERNGPAGNPAWLTRLATGSSAHAYRTAVGFGTCELETTTVLPSMRAAAPRLQTVGVREVHAHRTAFRRRLLEHRARVFERLAVGDMQCGERQA